MGVGEQVSRTRIKQGALCAALLTWTLCAADGVRASDHGAPAHDAHSPGEEHAEEAVDYSGLKTRGIDLGEYRVRAYYPVDAQKSTVRFMLHVAVASEHHAQMQRFVEAHKNKLRDQVITATRMSPLAIFDEPNLESFRRRVYLRLRRALPELAINDVYVSEFQLTVKSL
jgi:hypothetical protein